MENQRCWSCDSTTYKNQKYIMSVLCDSIISSGYESLSSLDDKDFREWCNWIFCNGFMNGEFIFSLIKCSKKSESYENWMEYKFMFCYDWIDFIEHVLAKLQKMNTEENDDLKLIDNTMKKLNDILTSLSSCDFDIRREIDMEIREDDEQ